MLTAFTSFFYLGLALSADLIQACSLHNRAATHSSSNLSAIAIQNNQARRNDIYTTNKIAIDNARVFNGHKILSPRTIVIDGSVIGTDPKGAEHIDAQGGVLIPGLIDSHCHPTNVTHLQDLSRYGVTTGFQMACFSPELCHSLQNHTGLTDLKAGSAAAAAPGSAHGNLTAMADHTGTLLVYNTSDATRWAAKQIALNPDFIKLIAESPGLSQDTLDVLTQESHAANETVVCHAAAYDAIHQAMTAGVDQIHHTPLDRPLDTYLVEQILHRKQISAPTLTMMQAISKTNPTSNFTAALESATLLHKLGVPILAGTDANLQPGLIASVPFGSSLHLEMELLVQAGMKPVEALRAATIRPTRHWGLHDRGVIAPGKRADLILIKGDPLRNISATRDIQKVWLAGVEYTGA